MTEAQRAARIENLEWMVENGETADRAARRLGITRNALEKWTTHNAPDLWRRLAAREPLPPPQRGDDKTERRRAKWRRANTRRRANHGTADPPDG